MLVVFADIEQQQLRPLFSWAQYRVFSRPASTGGSPVWPGLEQYEAVRPLRLTFSRPSSSTPPPFAHPIAYLMPAGTASVAQVELLVCPRPAWQRRFAQKVEFAVPAGDQAATVTISHRPSSTVVTPNLLSNGVGYQAAVPISEPGKAILFFLPQTAPVSGETITLLDASGASISSWGCAAAPQPFLTATLRARADHSGEPTLLVNLGAAGFPLPNQPINGAIVFPDGERITFAGRAATGCILEWPAHCPLEGAVFELSGTSGSAMLAPSVYTAVAGDKAFDGVRGLQLERVDSTCAAATLTNRGGSICVSTRFATGCGCRFCSR
jgi:hypothetical protein